jgi:ribose 5-phosphate isomerase B
MKQQLISYFKEQGLEVDDHGAHSVESVDYPDFAHAVATAVASDKSMGILLCGSANGVCMTANRHSGVRAAIAWTQEIARLARNHNDANVLCLPARFLQLEQAKEIADTFLACSFEGGRHLARIKKIES